MKLTIGIVIVTLFVGGIIWFSTNQPQRHDIFSSSENIPIQGKQIPILESAHIPNGTKVNDYNSNPPTSGKHYGVQADWGTYTTPLPDEIVVHNLEHGGIWISYKDIDNETKAKLEAIARKYNQAIILSPRLKNDSRIVLASWGRLQELKVFDENIIETFVRANINNSPEKFASLEQAKVTRNARAPEAIFTSIDGKQFKLSDFKGKKVMFWVLATWCPSCIAGAQVLAQNNDQLTSLTIIALKTYGNAGYPGPSIEEFARQYSPDMLSTQNWLWGDASQEATTLYNPRNFPDIYFLIDEDGILEDIDGAPAATINKIIQFANE